MPRAATTCDVFNAIAEPRRRDILGVLERRGEQEVGELVEVLGLAQPSVSKHLAVLRAVGLVSVRRRGRARVYRVEAGGIRTVHNWARQFERLWEHQIDRIKERAETEARRRSGASPARKPQQET